MLAYVFPGQGAQFKGMGKALFDQYADLTAETSDYLKYSIADLCLQNPDGKLNQTQFTQPALYLVNHLHYLAKLEENAGVEPDYLAGHSLGEYNALLAAGAFDFKTGLRLVTKRGELMSQAKNGGMAAVVGVESDDIQQALNKHQLQQIEMANLNSRTQTIISGPQAQIVRAEQAVEEAGGQIIPLPVSGAFHSRAMKPSAVAFRDYIRPVEFNWLRIPVIANFIAKPYPSNNIKDILSEQISGSVRWLESVEYLLTHGVTRIEQVGPGKILTDMVSRIVKDRKQQPSNLLAS